MKKQINTDHLYLEAIMKENGIKFLTEYRFHPTRKWRFDYVISEKDMIALEYEGGVYSRGRHTRGRGYSNDCEKYTEAALLGWKVIRVTTDLIKDGKAEEFIKRITFDKKK